MKSDSPMGCRDGWHSDENGNFEATRNRRPAVTAVRSDVNVR